MALAVLQPSRPVPPEDPRPIAFAEVVRTVAASITRLAATSVPLSEAEGLRLARPLVATGPIPPHALAVRAGWAVQSDDTVGAGPYSPALLPYPPVVVGAGDVLPAGCDAVLPDDAVISGPLGPECYQPATPGEDVRRTGDDMPGGTVLLDAGETLTALGLAAASAAGIETCEACRPTLVLLCPDGDSMPPGLALIARLASRRYGAVVRTAANIAPGAIGADLVVGAIGHGAIPFRSGIAVASRIAMRPGEDAAIHLRDGVPCLLLPDRLEDALALWLALIEPCLDLLTGSHPETPTPRPLTRKIASRPGLAELALLRDTEEGFEPLSVGRAPLQAVTRASHWLLVPADSEGYGTGTTVAARRLLLP